jgi:hypothetical protein
VPFVVATAKCTRMVCVNGEPAGPANKVLPVVEGTLVVSMQCECGFRPASHVGVIGGPLTAPTVVAFLCAEDGADA